MALTRKLRTDRKPVRPRPRFRPRPSNPRLAWPTWTDHVRFAPVLDGLDDAIADDAEPATGPSEIDDAFYAGFTLGIEGEYAAPPAEFGDLEAFMFRCGRRTGWRESPEGRAWFQSVATIDAARVPRSIDFNEAVEFGGVDAARSIP